jgi:hypothetical protein
MNKQKLNIWGRDFELDVVYEKYSGEEILQTQKTALQQFISAPNIIEASKTAVEQYCLKWNKDEIGTDKIDNLFKYIKPKSLYVLRSEDNTRTIAVLCAYKFYSDNKIAIVFKNEKLEKVVIDDEVI